MRSASGDALEGVGVPRQPVSWMSSSVVVWRSKLRWCRRFCVGSVGAQATLAKNADLSSQILPLPAHRLHGSARQSGSHGTGGSDRRGSGWCVTPVLTTLVTRTAVCFGCSSTSTPLSSCILRLCCFSCTPLPKDFVFNWPPLLHNTNKNNHNNYTTTSRPSSGESLPSFSPARSAKPTPASLSCEFAPLHFC